MLNFIKSEGVDIPAKKIKIDEYHIPDFHQQFMVLRHQPIPFMPFMPIPSQPSHAAATKLSLAAYNTPSIFNEPFTEPPMLQNPDRVVRLSESQKFESDFQPNVALVPRNKKDTKAISRMPASPLNQIVLVGAVVKQEQLEIKEEPPSTPPDMHQHQDIFTLPNCRTTCNHTPANSEVSQSGSNEITSSTSPVPAAAAAPPSSNNNRNSDTKGSSLGGDAKGTSEDTNSSNTVTPEPIEHSAADKRQTALQSAVIKHPDTAASSAIGMGELELSTDTDDESIMGEADSSCKSWQINELLKELNPDQKDKFISYVRLINTEKKKVQEANTNLQRELGTCNNQLRQLLQKIDTLKEQLLYYETVASTSQKQVDTPVIAVSSSDTNTSESGYEQIAIEQKCFLETTQQKPVTETIIKPLKKSLLRRSPEESLAMVMTPSNRDEIKIINANNELLRGVN